MPFTKLNLTGYCYATLGLIVTAITLCGAFSYYYDVEALTLFAREDGAIETATASLAALYVIWLLIDRRFSGSSKILGGLTIGFIFARELDWHKAFTTESILKPKFYWLEGSGLMERLIGALFVLLLIYTIIRLLMKLPYLLHQALKGSYWARAIILYIAILAIAKSLDSGAR